MIRPIILSAGLTTSSWYEIILETPIFRESVFCKETSSLLSYAPVPYLSLSLFLFS